MNAWIIHVFLSVLITDLPLHSCNNQCVTFDTGKNDTVAHTNPTATLHFTVVNNCDADNRTTDTVKVSRFDTEKQIWIPFCAMYLSNGSCLQSLSNASTDCSCDPRTHGYIVKRSDTCSRGENWKLSYEAESGVKSEKLVTIQVKKHPNITTLAVNETSPISRNIIVTRNTIVNVTCDWDEGYPSQTARLTKDGVKLNSDYDVPRNDTRCQSLRRTNYVIQHAQCSDSGLITCEAAGSAHNKSFTLLVRCEPQFRNNHSLEFVISSTDLTLRFPVLAHETKITECCLKRYDNGQRTFTTQASVTCQEINCTGSAFLHGTAPDLTLTIQLSNVTSAMEGAWQLLLGNSEGSGSVSLSIKRAAAGKSVLVPLLVTSIVAVAIVFISLVIICCLKKKRQKKRKRGRKARKSSRENGQGRRDRRTPAVPSAFYRGSNVSLMITNDIYEGSGSMRTNDPFGYSEVRDRLRESPPGGAATDVGRTAGASSPTCEVDGYFEIGDACVNRPKP